MDNKKIIFAVVLLGLVVLFIADIRDLRKKESQILQAMAELAALESQNDHLIVEKAHQVLQEYAGSITYPLIEDPCLGQKILNGPSNITFVTSADPQKTNPPITHFCKEGRTVTELSSPISRSHHLVAISLMHEYTHQCQFERLSTSMNCDDPNHKHSLENIVRYEIDPWVNALGLWHYLKIDLPEIEPRDYRHLSTIEFMDKHFIRNDLENGVRKLVVLNFPEMADQQEL